MVQLLLTQRKLLKWFGVYVLFFFSTQAEAQITVNLQTTPPLCGGFSTGEITASPSGGNAPYSYLWTNGMMTQTISNLPAGQYAVTVTDANDNIGTAMTIMTAPPPLMASISVLNCDLPGVLSVNPNGGIPPYDILWSNGSTTQTIVNLTAGEYCVNITDQNSCGFIICESVGPLIEIEVETTPVMCGGTMGGTATATITGGVAPIEILWSNGETTSTIENLTPGTYTVTVVGANGCIAEASGEVTIGSGTFDVDLDVIQPNCQGLDDGEITANPINGTSPFSYEWTNGDTTQTIIDLAPDIYSVTVTDGIGCTAVASTVINYQSNLEVNLVGVNPTCAGSNNGSVSAFPDDGVEPYEYLWSTGSTEQMIASVGEGTYMVTVTDSLGCVDSVSTTLVAPPSFMVNVGSTNASQCGENDGSASASISGGGNPPFSYQWNNGATSNMLTSIPAGIYSVTVTSSLGCTSSDTTEVNQPNILEVEITGSEQVCDGANNGELMAAVTYGNAPFEYDWSNGDSTQAINNLPAGTYNLTVTSAEGCTGSASAEINSIPGFSIELNPVQLTCFENNTGQVSSAISGGAVPLTYLWSNGEATPDISNLSAGEYSLAVTDGNGCSAIESTTVEQPDEVSISFTTTGSCGANGSASADIMGGTPNYSFLWSNGQNTSAIFGLAPGDYTLTVTDNNGCVEIQTANVPAFPLVELDVVATNTTCNGTSDGTVTANVNNGTSPFDYLWSNGSTQSSQTGLTPGNYSVTATDGNQCQAFGSAFVALGAGLNVVIDAPTYVCPGQNAIATAMPSGGAGTYTYTWSNGQTTQTANGLTAGSYTVTVSDPSNCTGTATVFILPGGMYQVDSDQENIDCFGWDIF